ncbi:MAG: hypothetical protein DRQ10_05210 [Candidatus Hydrothermota bacterium]|nr:MAG: hypothetical protein DRQ10_05210 [Candidatus Hydrothermae bacterium]
MSILKLSHSIKRFFVLWPFRLAPRFYECIGNEVSQKNSNASFKKFMFFKGVQSNLKSISKSPITQGCT